MARSWFLLAAAACLAGLGVVLLTVVAGPLQGEGFAAVWRLGWLVALLVTCWRHRRQFVPGAREPGGGPAGKAIVLGLLATTVAVATVFGMLLSPLVNDLVLGIATITAAMLVLLAGGEALGRRA